MKSLTLTWLGQSGFIIYASDTTIACDLYLSDFCRKKSTLDHTRLMPITIAPEKLDFINHYLITHGHIDHFDPETVGPILRANPNTHFWCPPACRTVIEEYFSGKSERFTLANSGVKYSLTENIKLISIPAAHEDLEKDTNDKYIYFSYLVLFECEKKAVFFAGDTIPFAGQSELISSNVPPDYELTMVLPVNGRDKERAELGFKGNMDIDEAVTLANACGASRLVPCHFGMFALNDIPETISLERFEKLNSEIVIPVIKEVISL
jgi:L-ascorbate metabolism protein UlaG (beta-lactamase superfamily)